MAATINYYLDKPEGKKKTQIFIYFSFNGKRIKIASGHSIHPKDWNKDKQYARATYSDAMELNGILKSKGEKINKIYLRACLEGITPTPEYIRTEFFKEDEEPVSAESFIETFEKFIEVSKSTKMDTTIRGYEACLNHLKTFSNLNKFPLSFDRMDYAFYSEFVDYLFKTKKLLSNAAGKQIKNLKTFLSHAEKMGINRKEDYKKFKVLTVETEVLFLTKEELFAIYELDLSKNKRLEQVRDYFCFACFTGLRYSDINQLRPEHVYGNEIHITHMKTKKTNRVPLNSYAMDILNKYLDKDNERLFPVASNQKANEYLKEIGKEAKINTPIHWVNFRGSERIEKTFPKYDKISFHMAKKTFITNSLMFGMNERALMQITGNTDPKVLKRYIKITEDFKRSEMDRTWGKV